MNSMDLYEHKILSDKEFPVQLQVNKINQKGQYFPEHWHEHLELHYVLEGSTTIKVNQRPVRAKKGDLIIANSNELHSGYGDGEAVTTVVAIFEMEALSFELADKNIIFQSLIEADDEIRRIMVSIWQEHEQQEIGYKLVCKGFLLHLITYLCRNYALEMLSDRENTKRMKNLERLNTVVKFVQEHYSEPISNRDLADMVHLSEDRFNHFFKEGMGMPPLQYVNEVRLKKAAKLLKKEVFTVAEVAALVGISDYNYFGRIFRRYFGCTPSEMVKNKSI